MGIMNRKKVYKPGTVLMLTEGAYNDYHPQDILTTLVDLNIHEAADEYRNQYQPVDEFDKPNPYGFYKWLVGSGKCIPLSYETEHLGEYGELTL